VVRTVPVVVEKLPAGYELESVEPQAVTVTIQGLRRDLIFQARSPVEVHIDALLVKLGRRTFQIDPAQIRTPSGLEAVAVEPEHIVLSVRTAEAAPAD